MPETNRHHQEGYTPQQVENHLKYMTPVFKAMILREFDPMRTLDDCDRSLNLSLAACHSMYCLDEIERNLVPPPHKGRLLPFLEREALTIAALNFILKAETLIQNFFNLTQIETQTVMARWIEHAITSPLEEDATESRLNVISNKNTHIAAISDQRLMVVH